MKVLNIFFLFVNSIFFLKKPEFKAKLNDKIVEVARMYNLEKILFNSFKKVPIFYF